MRFLFMWAVALAGVLGVGSQALADGHAFTVKIQNNCWQRVQVAVRYKHLNDEWRTRGWYQIEPNASKVVLESRNTIYYFYAESQGTFWSGDDKQYKIRGENVPYGFRRKEITRDSFGESVVNLNCDNALPYRVRVANDCNEKLQVAMRYVDPDTGDWRTRGYFTFEPYERGSIGSTRNSIIYLHGGRSDSRYYTGPELRTYRVRGNDEKFFRKDLKEEGAVTNFIC